MANDTNPALTLGFIGLGVMGRPMCRNLQAATGRSVLVYDRVPDALAKSGAEATASVAELAGRAENVFLVLPGEAEVRQVCLGDGGLLGQARAGQCVVDCSTSPVALAHELAAAFQAKGVAFADAPIAGTFESVSEREISLMVGAAPETYARIRPQLEGMARHVQHCGPVGTGQTVKLLLNTVIAQNVVALAEALTLGRKAGVEGAVLFEALARGADSFALRQHGMTSLLPDRFPEGQFPTHYMLKDVNYLNTLAEALGLELGGAKLAERLLQRTAEMGHGDRYWPALIKAIEAGG